MLVHSLAWRKLHNIDRILDGYKPPDVLEKYYPGGWHYCDKGELFSNINHFVIVYKNPVAVS